jgi:hypothetical protein
MDTQNHQFAEQTAITASVVPDELRIGFWPALWLHPTMDNP